MQAVRILVADDIKNTRESIRRILNFNSEIEVVGEASCGSEALRLTELLRPDIILMDINMPDIDGIKTAELLSFRAPNTSVIMMSVHSEPEYLTKSMLAGAKAYIVKPFTGNELISTIMNVFHKEARKREIITSPSSQLPQEKNNSAKIISVISTKGGVGKTTTAVNVAVELVKSKGLKVLLMDLNLQFGDIASFLNLVPKRTICDLAQSSITLEEVRYHILHHSSGVEVLAASTRPEYAEIVTPDHIDDILQEVHTSYDYIICDNISRFDEISLASMDFADEIWFIVGLDIPSIKNAKLSLELLHSLEYTEKIKLILNKFDKKIGISIKDIESSLGRKLEYIIPEEEQFTLILNKGIPYVEALPRSQPAQEIKKIASDLASAVKVKLSEENDKSKEKSGIHKIFADFGLGS